ncbi:hypothetical protein PHEL85_0979 [Polaribacter sp. Hel1_85]|nr:hypothetical protein PHEL85_0979 [Polaribacter sp. Hel1_85]
MLIKEILLTRDHYNLRYNLILNKKASDFSEAFYCLKQ